MGYQGYQPGCPVGYQGYQPGCPTITGGSPGLQGAKWWHLQSYKSKTDTFICSWIYFFPQPNRKVSISNSKVNVTCIDGLGNSSLQVEVYQQLVP